MILADKIILLRKKSGWSQEELAQRMDVSRQSVSKWEGAQAVPDLGKVLRLSQIFGVSTDYLLKDEIEEAEYLPDTPDSGEFEPVWRVTMEEANSFLAIKAETARRIALATFICILSPVCLILLAAAAQTQAIGIGENPAAGLGMVVMFVMVAVAVAIYISCGVKTSRFEYLEHETFETEYGVSGMVRERREGYKDTYTRGNIFGAVFCILSLVPLFAGMAFTENELMMVGMLSLLLLIVSIGVASFIVVGINWASMRKLLQEGEYAREQKKKSSHKGAVITAYWMIATAVYLAYSFITMDWRSSWVVWPVAGVLSVAVAAIYDSFGNNRK